MQIFIEDEISGEGFYVHVDGSTIMTEHPIVCRMNKMDGEPIVKLTREGTEMVRRAIATRQSDELKRAGRLFRTNSTAAAANNTGTVATVYTSESGYKMVERMWSRWQGEEEDVIRTTHFTRLADAVHAAESACRTSPSFGDVERVR